MKLLGICFAVACALGTAASAATVYATNQNTSNGLYSIDTVTNTSSLVGSIGFNVSALAASATGDLYGVTFTDLIKIDTNTGAGTLIGPHGLSLAEGLTFLQDGTLIGSSTGTGNIASIDLNTGASTVLGSVGRDIDGLTVAPVDIVTIAGAFSAGTLFAVDSGSIFAIDLNTFTTTILGSADAFEGIAFDKDGTLFGAGTGVINEIDLMTLATTNTVSSGFGTFVGGLSSSTPFPANQPPAVPLPAGFPLILAALGTFAFVRRFK